MASKRKVAELYAQLTLDLAEFRKATNDATQLTNQFKRDMTKASGDAKQQLMLVSEELGIAMPRALRGFIAQLPGVATALNAAFNSVAVIGIIALVVQATDKVAEFAKKNREAAEALKQAYEDVNIAGGKSQSDLQAKFLESQKAVDELRGNHLKALKDELQVINLQSLDQLGSAFDNLSKKTEDVFDKMKVDWADVIKAFVTSGTFATGGAGQLAELKRIQNLYDEKLYDQSVSDPSQRKANANGLIQSQLAEHETNWNNGNRYLQLRASGDLNTDEGYEINRYFAKHNIDPTNVNSQWVGNEGTLATTLRNFASQLGMFDKITQNKLTGAKITTGNQMDSERFASFENKLAQLSADRQVSGKSFSDADRTVFWQKIMGTLPFDSRPSSLYQKVNKEYNDSRGRWAGEANQLDRKYRSEQAGTWDVTGPLAKIAAKAGGVESKVFTDMALEAAIAKSSLETTMADIKVYFSDAYAQVQTMLKSGDISPQAAAIQEATLHSQEYQGAILALTSAQRHGIDTVKEQAQVTAEWNRRQGEDADATRTLVEQIFGDIRKNAQDTQEKLRALAGNFVGGINDQVANAATGGKTNFSGVFQGAAHGLFTTGLQKFEGSLFGGPKGTRSNPMITQDVNDTGGKAHSAIGDLTNGSSILSSLSKTSGLSKLLGWANDNDWLGSHLGGLFGAGGMFGVHHAVGGAAYGGVPIPVGELGPELFVPPGNGSIIPNNRLGSSTTVAVDARGANDPAAVEASVHRAMIGYLPMLKHASVDAVKDNARRRPSGK